MLTHIRTPKHSINLSVRFQISTCSVCKCFLSPFKMKSTYFAWIHYSCQTIENINNSMPQSLHFTDKNSQNFDILHISNNCLYMYSLLAEVYSITLHLVIQTRCREKKVDWQKQLKRFCVQHYNLMRLGGQIVTDHLAVLF